MSNNIPENDALNTMDEALKITEIWTGIRQQFIDHGWTPAHAEEMVIEILRSSIKN